MGQPFQERHTALGRLNFLSVNTANDHHAHQEIAYLLQRMEDFPGVVVLASHLRSNIDEAFSRRCQSMVYFTMPDAGQRLRLWRSMLAEQHLDADVKLPEIATRYELSGGDIANVIRHAALASLRQQRSQVRQAALRAGLAKELRKEGRPL